MPDGIILNRWTTPQLQAKSASRVWPVLQHLSFSISPEPPIIRGEIVLLKAIRSSNSQTTYDYTWTITDSGATRLTEKELEGAETQWDTSTAQKDGSPYYGKCYIKLTAKQKTQIGRVESYEKEIDLVQELTISKFTIKPELIPEDSIVELQIEKAAKPDGRDHLITWITDPQIGYFEHDDPYKTDNRWFSTGVPPQNITFRVVLSEVDTISKQLLGIKMVERQVQIVARSIARGDILPVAHKRTAAQRTEDLPLWVVIKKSTEAVSFENYSRFLDGVLCGQSFGENENYAFTKGKERYESNRDRKFLPYNDVEAYRLLKVATEAFLMANCGVAGLPFKNAIFDADGNPVMTEDDVNDLVQRVNVNGKGMDLAALEELWQKYLKYMTNGTDDATIPYLALVRNKLGDSPLKDSIFYGDFNTQLPEKCQGIIREKLTNPCLLELIWSYWQEEGMLVQTLKAISMRFQNIRTGSGRDPLANMEIDALRPLNNLLWGLIQDEQHLLTVARRAYEYDHHYGISLFGKALPNMRPADSRSKFMEAFHNLLHLCSRFYMADDDTTVIADGFPMLNALKEVHLVLSEGAHNQFGDLPSTARVEMLMQQWLLSRPELREFLPTRMMVAYPEPWMDRVDAMKKVQGWTDTPVLHFRNLAMFGEKVLLSVRYGSWNNVEVPAQASNWARFWRAEIQGYIHAYRSVTGIDMTADVVNTRDAEQRFLPPSHHLRNRLQMQLKRA